MKAEEEIVTPDGSRIAIFENCLILNAQPAITDAQLCDVEKLAGRPVPPGLVALWQTAYGGDLDYDLKVDFNGHVASFSFSEIFYPGSEGYHDLLGWIEHEFECALEAEDEDAKNGRLPFLPFGGFEYLDRMYVCLEEGEDYGAVFAWMRGLPPAWSLRLHNDSLARIADDVPALFQLLALDVDPFAPDRPEFCSGCDMADLISEIGAQDLETADRLTALVRANILDWKASLEAGKIAEDDRLRRLALDDAATRGDLNLVALLSEQGCDLNERFGGGGNLLDHFLAHGHNEPVDALIALGIDSSNAIISAASEASPETVRKLIGLGAKVDTVSALTAALQGLPESAKLMVDQLAIVGEWGSLQNFPTELEHCASQAEKYPINNLSPEQNGARVANVRLLRNHVVKKLRAKKLQDLPIINRFIRL